MRRNKHIILAQLDEKISKFREVSPNSPSKGWIYTIRKSIGMSLQQLADRMNVSKQNISLLEKREAAGGITLNSLRELGKAMDLRLVYGFVSIHESLDEMVERRAKELAKNIVMRTDNSMILEDQKVSYKIKQDNIDALAEEIKREMPRYLWAH